MGKKRAAYNHLQKVSAIFMILTLAWLTVSTAFIYPGRDLVAKQGKAATQLPTPDGQEEESKPLPNSTEEKNPPSNSLSEEYLHESHVNEYFFSLVSQRYVHENAGTYIAFHGELHAPPPNAA